MVPCEKQIELYIVCKSLKWFLTGAISETFLLTNQIENVQICSAHTYKWKYIQLQSELPWPSTWATAWKCPHGVHTAVLCPQCHRKGRSVCPAGTGSTHASGCSFASGPVKRDETMKCGVFIVRTRKQKLISMICNDVIKLNGLTAPPLWPAGQSTAAGLTSFCAGSMSPNWPCN